jgi:small subunit ribosomal protein S1
MTESFEDLLNESFSHNPEGSVIVGTVIRIENDLAIIDVGLKSEGRVPLKEFAAPGQAPEIKPGDTVEVYMERFENRDGEVILSRDKARREEAWIALERQYNANERIEGVIVGRVKGGFTVDLNGVIAFLPGSQVDIRPIRDFDSIMNTPQPFQILKLDRARGNIVISRRAVLEESRAEERAQLISTLKEGMQLSGVVKNITDYGAFVDLGGVDGLLHVTDMSWRRVNHPTEVVNIGQQVEVIVTKFNAESQRISLGMKQLLEDPWNTLSERYPRGTRVTGRVSNITDYGAFVELESGIEGLVHISEMSWTKKNVHPGKIVSTSQEVEVVVLNIDTEKRRISLGIKQTQDSPWVAFSAQHPPGSIIEGEVKNTTEFGLFIGLDADIDGMVHLSDLSWEQAGEEAVKQYQKGDRVQVKVLDVNTEKERVSLGIKQLNEDPFQSGAENLKRGDVVTVVVSAVQDNGIEVSVNEGLTGFIKRADLARDHDDQHPDRFAVGDRVDAKITQLDMRTRKLSLSIKAQEADEEKAAMDSYGSSSSGASLGDILTAAMKDAKQDDAPSAAETADADSTADKSSETSDSEPKAAKKTPKKSASTSAAKSKASTAAKVSTASKETAEPEDSENA